MRPEAAALEQEPVVEPVQLEAVVPVFERPEAVALEQEPVAEPVQLEAVVPVLKRELEQPEAAALEPHPQPKQSQVRFQRLPSHPLALESGSIPLQPTMVLLSQPCRLKPQKLSRLAQRCLQRF